MIISFFFVIIVVVLSFSPSVIIELTFCMCIEFLNSWTLFRKALILPEYIIKKTIICLNLFDLKWIMLRYNYIKLIMDKLNYLTYFSVVFSILAGKLLLFISAFLFCLYLYIFRFRLRFLAIYLTEFCTIIWDLSGKL